MEKSNLKNILTKKNLAIIFSIGIVLLAAAIFIPPAIVSSNIIVGTFSKNDVFVLKSYDPFNPTYAYISNRPDQMHGNPDRGIAVIKFNRPNILLPYFHVDKVIISGKTQHINLEEILTYVRKYDLVEYNPNPDYFVVPSQNLRDLEAAEKNKPPMTSEDRYYLEYSTYSDLKKMSVNDFKKLKKGMTWSYIEASGFDYDNARSSGLLSNKYERRARVQESDVMFVVMAFAEDIDDKNPNAPLEDVYIVYSDRSNKKLDLESK